MLSCKDITKLVSESLDRKLPWWTRVNIRMHSLLCGVCSGFRKDLLHIRDESRRHSEEFEDFDKDVQLSDDARNRMRKLMESNE